MPQKNSIKIYYENAYYHVYNRGVEKRDIFLDHTDYLFFLHLFKTALLPPPSLGQGGTLSDSEELSIKPRRKKFHDKIDLMAYCLLPNHYHFLIQQKTARGLTEFIRSLSTAYSMYFNKKYRRVGSLFQGVFKATDIREENYLLWVSRYIHRNPLNYQTYSYSSYGDYLRKRKTNWLKPSTLLEFFKNNHTTSEKSYQEFVEANTAKTSDDFSMFTLEPEDEETEKRLERQRKFK